MFGSNSTNEPALRNRISKLELENNELREEKRRQIADHAIEIKSLKQDHVLALEEKENDPVDPRHKNRRKLFWARYRKNNLVPQLIHS